MPHGYGLASEGAGDALCGCGAEVVISGYAILTGESRHAKVRCGGNMTDRAAGADGGRAEMNIRRLACMCVCIGAITPAASALSISTTTMGGVVTTKFCWDVVVGANDKFASIHINGPGTGVPGVHTAPAGWVFTGMTAGGDYSWENSANVGPGTYQFCIDWTGPWTAALKSSLEFDYFDAAGTRVNSPFPAPAGVKDATNWATVPVPAPGTAALLGLGALVTLRRRRA